MSEDLALEVLKQAILLERQGKLFYEQVSLQSQSEAVSGFFTTMAEEEDKHVEILSDQFAGYTENGQFADPDVVAPSGGLSAEILARDIRSQISAASYEAAAISAAIEMENRAVRVYSGRAEASTDDNEQRLYRWLAQWEKGHLRFLAEINAALLEDIWHENNFWPF